MVKEAHLFGKDKFDRLLGVSGFSSPGNSKLNQLKDGDHEWFTEDQKILLDSDINKDVKYSDIMVNMKNLKEEISTLDLNGEDTILESLDVDLTKKTKNTGLFGKNIERSNYNDSLVSNANSKLVFEKVIKAMTSAFELGQESIEDTDILGFSYSSNIGHNPSNYPSFVNDSVNKHEFLEHYWDDFDIPEYRKKDKERYIIGSFRKTFDKKNKQRPAFFLSRTTGKLYEGVASNEDFGFRNRYVAGLSWYDNGYWMYINQCCLLCKSQVPLLSKHIDYTTNTILDKINATGKEAFATDVASADYTHKLEDLEFFFDVFLKGALKTSFEDIFKVRKIAGAYYDLKGKPIYYIQFNFGRFLSGTGLTYWINVAKYLTCQLLNLISYDRVMAGRVPTWHKDASLITSSEIDSQDAFNKGDDALDMIKPGTKRIYRTVIEGNPYIVCEEEDVLGFDGKSLSGTPSYYNIHTRYKSCATNLVEKREGRKASNPNNSLFYSSIQGKIDLLKQFPTVDEELGYKLLGMSMKMITGKPHIVIPDDKFIKMKAEEETRYLLGNDRQIKINQAVSLLGLKGSHDLSHAVTARDLAKLPIQIREALFISVPMTKIRDVFEGKFLQNFKFTNKG